MKLPAGYASLYYDLPPGLTESTTMIGAAIIKSFRYNNQLERVKFEGRGGFVAGFVDMKAAATGVGGTKYDTERLTISCLHGEHATKSWPGVGDSITLSGMTGDAAKCNGKWSIVSENADYARKSEADKGYELERYADVSL